MELTLENVEAMILGMAPEDRKELEKTLEPILKEVWLPQPGPQSDAYYSEADELLYGGSAGGGKTDLIAGLALTAHDRSLIFRRQSTDLDGFWARLEEIASPVIATNNNVKKRMVTTTRKIIEGGHLDAPGSEKTWQGRPHDLIGFDEGAQLDEMKVSFVSQWLRSTREGQRTRIVIATNPPIPEFKNGKLVDFGAGLWLKEWFAPWLDEAYSKPAESGELRHCYMLADGDRLKTVWVDAPGTYNLDTGDYVGTLDEFMNFDGKTHVATRSRSFIRSKLKDNVFLASDGVYAKKLSSTPEPLRSLLMDGDFSLKMEDNPWQVIPTNWVLEAQERWRKREADGTLRQRQLVICADIAQGGSDSTTLGMLLDDNVFDNVERYPGSETPEGPDVVVRLMSHRRDRSMIVLDGGGGWAGDTKRTLQTYHNIKATIFQPSISDGGYAPLLNLKYLNLRASAWWRFRMALDPENRMDVCLPPNKRLQTQLTAVLWHPDGKFLKIESKDDVRARIGSSTDEADCVIMAWYYRDHALLQKVTEEKSKYATKGSDGDLTALNKAMPMKDPLSDW